MYLCIRHACIKITDPHYHTRHWCTGFSEGASGRLHCYAHMMITTNHHSFLIVPWLFVLHLFISWSYETVNIGLDLVPFSEKVENL